MRIELLDIENNIVSIIDTTDPAAELEFYGPQLGAVAWREYQPPAPTLDDLKAAAWDQVKARREAEDRRPLPYMDKLLDFDDAGREKLLWALKAADVAGAAFAVDWTCADNTILPLTAETIAGIPVAAAMRSDANHQKARLLRDAIDAASTPEELAMVSWDPLPEPDPEMPTDPPLDPPADPETPTEPT